MRTTTLLAGVAVMALCLPTQASEDEILRDSTLNDVVVTGTRAAVQERAIVSTVSTITRQQLNQLERVSLLPTLSEYVPNLLITQRGVMGFGVSGGAAGASASAASAPAPDK